MKNVPRADLASEDRFFIIELQVCCLTAAANSLQGICNVIVPCWHLLGGIQVNGLTNSGGDWRQLWLLCSIHRGHGRLSGWVLHALLLQHYISSNVLRRQRRQIHSLVRDFSFMRLVSNGCAWRSHTLTLSSLLVFQAFFISIQHQVHLHLLSLLLPLLMFRRSACCLRCVCICSRSISICW